MNEMRESPMEKADLTPWFYATKPTRWTLFLRTFVPWQMLRFAAINLKMIAMIRRSHSASQ